MAGLLDDWMNQQPTAGGLLNVDDMKRAQQMGLFGGLGRVAEALMMQGQPSRTPGGGIGSAFAAFPGGYAQAQGAAADSAVKQKVMGQQFDMNKVNLQQAQYNLKREQDWYGGGGQTQMVGTPQPNGEVVGPAGPAGATPAAMGMPGSSPSLLDKLPADVREQVRMLGPDAGRKWLADYAAKQIETNEWEDAEQDGIKGQRNKRSGKFEPFPASALSEQWERVPGTNLQRNKRTGEEKPVDNTSRTTINMPTQRKAEDEIVGKEFGQMYVDLQKNSMQIPGKIAKLDRINGLLSNTYTGAGGEANLAANKALKAAGDAMGLDTSGISDKVGAGEAATALSREIALGLRNPQGGAGMPGALSNSDREYLASMTPNLSMTPQGRAQLIDAQRKLYQREQEVARMARDYRQKRGNIDEGFFNELDAYSKANPLFKGAPANGAGGGGLGGDDAALVNKYLPKK